MCRIIEIEWAVQNNKAFKPSPKRPKKKTSKAKTKDAGEMDVDGAPRVQADAGHVLSDDQMEVDEVETSLTFGTELTNTGSKRGVADAGMETPAKRARGKKQRVRVVMIESDEDEDDPGAAPRKNRRRVGPAAA
jgi:kinesin family protein 22